MLITICFLLGALCGFLEASEECETPVLQQCDIDDYTFDIPTTKDGLTEICKNGKQALQCIVSLLQKCEANETDIAKMAEIQSNVNALCYESNILHQVVYENIECIGSALTSAYFGCPESIEKSITRVITVNGTDLDLSEQPRCLSSLFLVSCHITHTRKLCGKEPADAALEIYKVFHLPKQCKPSVAAKLVLIVETIELVEQEEAEF